MGHVGVCPAQPGGTEVLEVAQSYFAAWARRDVDAIVAMHSDDTRFWAHGMGGPFTGRAAVRDAFANIFTMFPEFGFETYRVLYGPDFWVLDWALLARVDRRPVRFDALDVVTVSPDGLVVRKDTFVDHAQMEAALDPPG